VTVAAPDEQRPTGMAAPVMRRVVARCRVVVDNDYAGDPDGLVGLAHHLLSPTNRVTAITSSFLNPRFAESSATAEEGVRLAAELVDVVGTAGRPLVVAGAEEAWKPGSRSAAADAIVAAALEDDELPLFVVCGGPLTNVAAALEQEPAIATRMTLVWIGGSLDVEAFEYNRDTDPAAAEFVFSRPGLVIHQFPLETYRQCGYSMHELAEDVGTAGRLGAWLWEHYQTPPEWVELGGVWPLGDSPPVLVTALSTESSRWTTVAPPGGAAAHVCTDVDFRLVVGDMLAKLRGHERLRSTMDRSE
jgi:purine nucleosidase